MRNHILSKFSKIYRHENVNNNYYDEVTQISYKDEELKNKVVTKGKTNLTETLESSDADEFSNIERVIFVPLDKEEQYFKCSSKETRTIETSDVDEFNFS